MTTKDFKNAAHVPPISVRVSIRERRALEKAAAEAGMPLSTFMRSKLFTDFLSAEVWGLTRAERDKVLVRVLRRLGESELLRSMRTLSDAAKLGTLITDKSTASSLHRACEDIQSMRRDLVKALGLRQQNNSDDAS